MSYFFEHQRRLEVEYPENDVKARMQKYIDGTYNGDADMLRQCFYPQAVMNGYLNNEMVLRDPEPFFQEIANNPSMVESGVPYKGEIASIDVVGNIASTTVKETGFTGVMKFTKYFHLIKVEGEWKIISKIFTTEN
jgi:hypothetical protein